MENANWGVVVEEEDKWSGGKTIPVLALRPSPGTVSSSCPYPDPTPLPLRDGIDHCGGCPDAVPGLDDPPDPLWWLSAYCSRPRPPLEDGLEPAPLEDDGRRPLRPLG